MISHRKPLLRRAEYIAAAYSTIALLTAVAVRAGRISPEQVESKLFWVLAIAVYIGGMWMVLCQEYAALLYGPKSEQVSDFKLSFADVRFMQHWCPRWIKCTYAVAAVLLVYVVTLIGHVKWSSHQPFRQSDAIGFLLLSSAFMLLAWPTIASASRMPGTFAERLAQRRDVRDGA